jgi:hypothetical protein
VAPCLAEGAASSASSAGSSASSAGSASSGSLSDSLNNSSGSSTGTKTADGDYHVIEVAELADRPDMLALTLHAAAIGADHRFTLKLPRQALAPRGIATGELVHVRNRDYGLEFARPDGATAREPFFLVPYDNWHRELQPHVVAL